MSRASRKEEEDFVPGGMNSVCKMGRGVARQKEREACRVADASSTRERTRVEEGKRRGKAPLAVEVMLRSVQRTTKSH